MRPNGLYVAIVAGLFIFGCGSNPGNEDACDGAVIDDNGSGTSDVDDSGNVGMCSETDGLWGGSGTCAMPSMAFPSPVCIRQSGCGVQLYTEGFFVNGSLQGSVLSTAANNRTCTGTMSDDSGDVTFTILGISCDGTLERRATPGVSSVCCEIPLISGKACPTGEKCTLIGDFDDAALVSACVQTTGMGVENDPCTRNADGRAGFGHDDCAAPLFCSFNGNPAGTGTCRRYCETDQRCGGNLQCKLIESSVPRTGECVPYCLPFGDSSDCAANTTCGVADGVEVDSKGVSIPRGFCRAVGEAAVGSPCAATESCSAGLMCHEGFCRTVCDDAHACSTGMCTFKNSAEAIPRLGVCL